FVYNGEVQATLFKKWVCEVRFWVEQGCLKESKGINLAGKYLGRRAYRFFEHDVISKWKDFNLTEFFSELFDYVFPVDFCMQQHDKFDTCKQDNHTAIDFL
ncbi:hypothetical protein CPB84DRAFT_1691745, partial [Gymnopilus junonius]